MMLSVAPATVTSSTRLFPANRSTLSPRIVPLSIIDNKVLRFSPTGGYWFYDLQSSVDRGALIRSLEEVLSYYPQLAGQLRRRVYEPESPAHQDRYGRLEVAWGSSGDPGVQLDFADSSHTIADIIPSDQEQLGTRPWSGDHIPSLQLLPEAPLALHDTKTSADLPSAIVQLTNFACGGVCLAIKMAHPLADAQSLLSFMHDWSTTHRALVFGRPLPTLSPFFDPSQLDRAAAGDIDSPEADTDLLARAQKLPLDRFDYWASSDGTLSSTEIPPEILARPSPPAPSSTPIPWSEWDTAAPVAHHLFYFPPKELARLKALSTPVSLDASSSSLYISHLDALLAQLWSLISRARDLPPKTLTTLNLTLGLRPRLPRPLPPTSLGSPILLVAARPEASTSSQDLASVASSIRSTVNAFDGKALGALLHEAAFEDSPSRYWGGFLGERHTIVTSWTRLGVWEVDFGFRETKCGREERGNSKGPRWMLPLMPHCDGLVQVMEGAGRDTGAVLEGGRGLKGWQEDGALVGLYLKREVMEKVLVDPLLHR